MNYKISSYIKIALFYLFRLFPLQNKIVATTFKGKKYGDNPQYILEALYSIDPQIDFVWLKDQTCAYELPRWLRAVSYKMTIRTIYEMATAKVWIDTHRLRSYIRKRKKQVFIETWHGGLGIKKIENDVTEFKMMSWLTDEIVTTNKLANVFISQSEHLSSIYRNAFGYQGVIWKCGYPKNDIIINGIEKNCKERIRNLYQLYDKKLFLYAPSFRDYFGQKIDESIYKVDYAKLQEALEKRFGGNWAILVRWHPLYALEISQVYYFENVIDVTSYPDMQELIILADAMMSDYSSCLFDGALRNIPCFTFATDFDAFKKERGVYFEMEDLPFPYAKDNDELMSNIEKYNHEIYLKRWEEFKKRTGLVETGHASKDIAFKIKNIIDGEKVTWKN